MKLYIDIDPMKQDWGEDGHYDYDAVYSLLAEMVRQRWPQARLTRERYAHEPGQLMRLMEPDGDADLQAEVEQMEADARLCDLPWCEPA